MSKMTSYIIRIQSIVLALLVLTLSSGFTYHWQGCLHADAEPICAVVDQTCCCSQTPQTAECLCADIGDKSCELSFSKYIQFNFETQLSDSLEFQTKLATDAKALYRFGSKEPFITKHKIFPQLTSAKIWQRNSPSLLCSCCLILFLRTGKKKIS